MFHNNDITLLLAALNFAAVKHRNGRRKDKQASPYINHPIEVAQTLWQIGAVRDMITIIGALLHDTLEDTDTTATEIQDLFGTEVLSLVQEVTDDKSLPKLERKRLQIEHAPHHTTRAKQLKLADKICNIGDIGHSPPKNWSLQRCNEYLDWAEQVVVGLRGINQDLDAHYDSVLIAAKNMLNNPKTGIVELKLKPLSDGY